MTNLFAVGDRCPSCGRRTAVPDDSITNGAWYCGDCDMFRIPVHGSDLDREIRTILDIAQHTEPDVKAGWLRSKFRVITGEGT